MNSLVRVTIRVSLVLGLSLTNWNVVSNSMAYAFDDSRLPDYQLDSNTSSPIFSPIFSPGANNNTEDEPYDPGDVGNPNNGDGAGSR
jgi:hypothetical protein